MVNWLLASATVNYYFVVIMRWLLTVSILTVCFAVATSNTDGYSISCSSEFTPEKENFCVGIPLRCEVQLNDFYCSGFTGPVLLSTSDILLQVGGSDLEPTAPAFTLSQREYLLTVLVDYHPTSFPSTLRVRMSSFHAGCTFDVDTNSLDVSSKSRCSYPLLFDVTNIYPSYPGEVEGGDIISLTLNLTASTNTIEDFVVAVGNYHPGLLLLSNSSYYSTNESVNRVPYTGDIHDLSSDNFQPIMFFSQLSLSEGLFISLSFQVQPFVLPKAALYFSFHVFYYISSYGVFTFKTSTAQHREFVMTSPHVQSRAFTLNLPQYNDRDHVINAFPQHIGAVFEMHIPFYLPCVSTNLNIEVIIPEFSSGLYTTNVTEVTAALPTNIFSLPSLCDYRGISSFDPDACYRNSISNSSPPQPIVTLLERTETGFDTVYVNFGDVWRNVTVGDICTGNNPDPNCSCNEELAEVILTGVVLTNLPCEKQTLTDDVTIDLGFDHDVNVWKNNDIELSNEIPLISKSALMNRTNIAVTASSPAIKLLISSYTVDAGDSFNIAFEIEHNDEYSSFTAYDLNYTLSIDEHLVTNGSIMICLFNTSQVPFLCEYVPFINNTIIRSGHHDV